MKRVFLIVLDSFGIGEMPDAKDFKDEGSNTIKACSKSPFFHMPNMQKMGLFNIDGVDCQEPEQKPTGAYARMTESSKGKDTTIGHWEIGGIISGTPLPTFPEGFPKDLIHEFEKRTGRKVICNRPYSGTEVIKDYGKEQVDTGALIVYTSADSVFQIAAHEEIVPLSELYQYCETARELCRGRYGVGRIIARPFTGTYPDFSRTSNRHDYSLVPPSDTMLDILSKEGFSVIAVGKIHDIFAGKGITEMVRTQNNKEGMERTLEFMEKDFEGLCFTNLVDFDMLYGHRNDVEGYARALAEFDARLPEFIEKLRPDDLLMITADHGCDPSTPSTDHSREYTPFLISGPKVKQGTNMGTRPAFSDIAATILSYFEINHKLKGDSLLHLILKE